MTAAWYLLAVAALLLGASRNRDATMSARSNIWTAFFVVLLMSVGVALGTLAAWLARAAT